MALLDEIFSPLDLRRLGENQLDRLCVEIREKIVSVVGRNGGHLASPLGVVELCVALHYVFQSPVDSIVWDVGNQAYAHKLLTGRRERFDTLRQTGGLSGFCRRDESEHDCFGAGHASTSISAALGIAEAKRLKGDLGKTVAVIGDGGMTGGLAFEALNHAGQLERDLVVILNDNGMFISPHVGGMSSWLSHKLSGPAFNQFRRRVKGMLNNYPRYGERTLHWIRRVVEGTKAMFTPGILFEGFGFQYVGPVDGHDLNSLITILQNVRHLDGPVLVHVHTIKGKGYPPAEAEPSRFHGVGPFDVASGRLPASDPKAPPKYTKVFSDALLREAERDERVVAITAAMPDGTGLTAFAEKYPERFYDVGIAEEHAVTFAAGLACGGRRPVVAIYSTFLQRAYDMLHHDVCLQNLPVTFALDRAGVVGEDGPTHHGLFDLSYLASLPSMTVMAPADENELPRMLRTALELPGPAAFRYPRGAAVGLEPDGDPGQIAIGKGRVVHRPGASPKLAILTIGTMLHPALRAAEVLAEQGIPAIVADARFRKPLDEELIERLARDAGRILTVEENVLEGGFGQAVGACLQRRGLLVPLRALGVPDRFIPHGNSRDIRRKLGLYPGGIVSAALDLASAARSSRQSA